MHKCTTICQMFLTQIRCIPMAIDLVSVEIDVEDEKFLKTLAKNGIKMPVQCNEGFCGTCYCKANPEQFVEVHEQIGNLEPDENILPCSVKAKKGISKVIVELPAHLVPEHLVKSNSGHISPS